MASLTLRSRTVELNQEGEEFTAGESDGEQPSNQLEVLGSADEKLEGPRNNHAAGSRVRGPHHSD
jgi:hypothetical protein